MYVTDLPSPDLSRAPDTQRISLLWSIRRSQNHSRSEQTLTGMGHHSSSALCDSSTQGPLSPSLHRAGLKSLLRKDSAPNSINNNSCSIWQTYASDENVSLTSSLDYKDLGINSNTLRRVTLRGGTWGTTGMDEENRVKVIKAKRKGQRGCILLKEKWIYIPSFLVETVLSPNSPTESWLIVAGQSIPRGKRAPPVLTHVVTPGCHTPLVSISRCWLYRRKQVTGLAAET